MRYVLLISALLFTVACSKKDDTKPAESAPKTTTTVGSAAAPTNTGSAGAGSPAGTAAVALDCEKVLPQAMRDKYFKGATIKNDPSKVLDLPDGSGAHCEIEAPVTPEMKVGPNEKTWTGSVDVLCFGGQHAQMVFDSFREREMKTPDSTKVDIGKNAIAYATGNNGHLKQIKAWDDNSTCQVHTVLPAEIHKEDIAKDVIAALPLK